MLGWSPLRDWARKDFGKKKARDGVVSIGGENRTGNLPEREKVQGTTKKLDGGGGEKIWGYTISGTEGSKSRQEPPQKPSSGKRKAPGKKKDPAKYGDSKEGGKREELDPLGLGEITDGPRKKKERWGKGKKRTPQRLGTAEEKTSIARGSPRTKGPGKTEKKKKKHQATPG